MITPEKLLDDKIFSPFKMNRWENMKPFGVSTIVPQEGMLQIYQYQNEIFPILDHYDVTTCKKVAEQMYTSNIHFQKKYDNLIMLERKFDTYKMNLKKLQLEIIKILEDKYPELFKMHKKDILLMKDLLSYIPSFVEQLNNSKINKIIKKIDNLWDQMGDIGLEIRSYY
ncbi:MAG: hypothetical protein ACTSR3_08495 [Candidatus Helarchaeota archaeon]